MKLGLFGSRRSAGDLPGIVARVRAHQRTRELVQRVRPGEIALIDHVDLDRASAEALAARQVAAVVNVSPSISGRYPNLGPEVLVSAGIPLVDSVGGEVWGVVRDGDTVRLTEEGALYSPDGKVLALGTVQSMQTVSEAMVQARAGLSTQLEAFAADAAVFLRRERDLLLESVGVPNIDVPLRERPAVVAVRGREYRRELAGLRRFIKTADPVLIGVEEGADALLEFGMTPHLIVGTLDSVSDQALQCGAEVVVHVPGRGIPTGMARAQELGVEPVVFATATTTEDAAMLLADHGGASTVVSVGTQATLEEFLDQGRARMASTVMTRLRLGPKLVDARVLARLRPPRFRWAAFWLVLVTLAAIAVAAAAIVTPQHLGTGFWHDVWHHVQHWWHRL
jgi:uncharacterized membrane-anchored protein